MTPVLGIIASSNQQGRAGGPVSAYDSLATVTVPSGGLASLTFAGIPTGYSHLQLRINARSTSTSANGIVLGVRFNEDTGSNYSIHSLSGYQGISGGVEALGTANTNQMYGAVLSADGNAASIFSSTVLDVLDYNSTTKNKTIRSLGGYDINGSTSGYNYIIYYSGNWRSTSAVTSIQFTLTAGNYAQHSSFALYGVK